MGKYSELYLEIRNIAKTTEKMEKIIQNTSIKMINGNKLIEFCRLNIEPVEIYCSNLFTMIYYS